MKKSAPKSARKAAPAKSKKKPPLGSGKRFAALAKETSPALAAWIGRKKYGKKKMAAMATKGRKRSTK